MLVGSVCAIVQIAANLVSYPIFLSYLGYRQYGVWLTLAVAMNCVQFISAGLGPALTQATAESASNDRYSELAHYLIWSIAGAAFLGCGLLALLPPAMAFAERMQMDPTVVSAMGSIGPWFGLLGALTFAAECIAAMTAGIGKIHYVYIVNAVAQVQLLASTVALFMAGLELPSLVIGFVTARLFVLMMLSPVVFSALTGSRFPLIPSPQVIARLLKAGGVLLAGTSMNVFLLPFNRWCIAAVAGPGAVPVFDIGYTGSMQIRNVLEFGLRSLVPEAAGLRGAGREQAVRRLHAVWLRRVLYGGAALYALAALIAPFLLGLWLQGRMVPEQPAAFRLFLFAGFFSLAGAPAHHLLIGLRRLRVVFWSYVLQAAVNGGAMAAALAWSPSNIILAAAGAMGCAMLASTILLIVRLNRIRSTGEMKHTEDRECCPV